MDFKGGVTAVDSNLYDPGEKDPERRWLALAMLIENAGMGNDRGIVERMEALAVRGGDRRLEGEILTALGHMDAIRALQAAYDPFERPDSTTWGGDILVGDSVAANGSQLARAGPIHVPPEVFS